jgi:hypothetical protein
VFLYPDCFFVRPLFYLDVAIWLQKHNIKIKQRSDKGTIWLQKYNIKIKQRSDKGTIWLQKYNRPLFYLDVVFL